MLIPRNGTILADVAHVCDGWSQNVERLLRAVDLQVLVYLLGRSIPAAWIRAEPGARPRPLYRKRVPAVADTIPGGDADFDAWPETFATCANADLGVYESRDGIRAPTHNSPGCPLLGITRAAQLGNEAPPAYNDRGQ